MSLNVSYMDAIYFRDRSWSTAFTSATISVSFQSVTFVSFHSVSFCTLIQLWTVCLHWSAAYIHSRVSLQSGMFTEDLVDNWPCLGSRSIITWHMKLSSYDSYLLNTAYLKIVGLLTVMKGLPQLQHFIHLHILMEGMLTSVDLILWNETTESQADTWIVIIQNHRETPG